MTAICVFLPAARSIRFMFASLAGGGAKRHGFRVWLLMILACMVNALSAATFGLFTYTDNGTSIAITDYPTSATGAVDIPATINTKPVTSIGSNAFSGCNGLTSVTIPASVTSIGSAALFRCSGLVSLTIPNSVTSIGNNAFDGCNSLTSVTIPSSVTIIGSAVFQYCSGLTSVTIPNSVTSIGSGAFFSCSGLNSATIPNSVTSIGSGAFQSCSSLTSVTIPNSVTSIGSGAFQSCSSLTGVTIPNSVSSIGDWVFFQCSGLTNLAIPNSVTSIGIAAFSSCSGLTSVTIPTSVTSIGSNAFSRCSGLTGVTIPDSVTVIGSYAFQYCSGLTSLAIPHSVASIGGGTFQYCSGLTSITIPDSVTSIGTQAFSGCSGLTSITIPDSVTNIGDRVFHQCSSLTYVTIPSGVTSIGSEAFNDCSSLMSITVDAANSTYSSNESSILFNKAQTTLITFPGGKIGNYTIPNSVTSIGSNAFSGCSGLASVTIPSGVASIGSFAFQNCSGLTSVTVGNSVTSIEDSAFSGCTNLIMYYFKGNTPTLGATVVPANPIAYVYYLPGTTGWTTTFGGLGTVAVGMPAITAQVSSVVANPGENVAFSVIATTAPVAPLSYQWQRNGVAIVGATSAALALKNVQSANAGTYTVLITNDRGTVTSTATLSLASNNLYTQAQYEAALFSGYNLGYHAGTSQVTSNPNSYGLYNLSQVQALHVGTPLLAKDPATGHFTLTIKAQKSADLRNFSALPFSSGTTTIDAEGAFKFDFTSPDNAAFFRLETR